MLISTIGFRALLATVSAMSMFQPAEKSQNANPPQHAALQSSMRVVPMKHTSAFSVAKTLRELGGSVSVGAVDEKNLVLRGSSEQVQEIIDEVLSVLDVPSTTESGGTKTTYLDLGNISQYDAKELSQLLHTVISDPRTRFAVDTAGRTLVIQGTDGDVESARKLVEQLAETSSALTFHFAFLRGQVGGGGDSANDSLPPGLQDVAAALAESGVKQLSLMAPLTVRTNVGHVFESSAVLRSQHEGTASEMLLLQLRGSAMLQSDNKTVVLEVEAEIGNQNAKEVTDQVHFQVETTLTAELDTYTVLTAAPASTADGSAVALVVRVTNK